jgi:hypothetical protein
VCVFVCVCVHRLMEGKAGGYKFLSPQERWAHQVPLAILT